MYTRDITFMMVVKTFLIVIVLTSTTVVVFRVGVASQVNRSHGAAEDGVSVL